MYFVVGFFGLGIGALIQEAKTRKEMSEERRRVYRELPSLLSLYYGEFGKQRKDLGEMSEIQEERAKTCAHIASANEKTAAVEQCKLYLEKQIDHGISYYRHGNLNRTLTRKQFYFWYRDMNDSNCPLPIALDSFVPKTQNYLIFEQDDDTEVCCLFFDVDIVGGNVMYSNIDYILIQKF